MPGSAEPLLPTSTSPSPPSGQSKIESLSPGLWLRNQRLSYWTNPRLGCRGKKRKKFLAYYNMYFEKIYRYMFSGSDKKKELAEDLTSDVILKAYENFEDFDEARISGPGSIKSPTTTSLTITKKVKKKRSAWRRSGK
jgi:hypothetical protein